MMDSRTWFVGWGLVVALGAAACESGTEASGDGDGDNPGDGDGDTSSGGEGGAPSTETGGNGSMCRMEFSPPGDTALDALTQEQAVTICLEYGEAFLCAFPESFNCHLEALRHARQEGGDDPEVCRAHEAACLEVGSLSKQEYTDCDGAEVEPDCSVTVAEAEACWQELLEQSIALERPEFSCDEVAEYFEWSDGLVEEVPESCTELWACE